MKKLTQQQKRRIMERRLERREAFSGTLSIDPQLRYRNARVVTQHGAHLVLLNEEGQVKRAHVLSNLGTIVCGDKVHYQQADEAEAIVVDVEARHSALTRLGFGGREKVLAANVDQILIVLASAPEPVPSLIDRYLVAAEYWGLEAILLINKADLLNPSIQQLADSYAEIGYSLIYSTAVNGDGLQSLTAVLRDKISILVGQSGVGKTSLTNALIPDLSLKIQEINASTQLGNHTTSSTTLYPLPTGGALIDSPGVRSFEIDHLPLSALQKGYREIYPYLSGCRFSDCRHLQDPGCALTDALAAHKIHRRRIESYLQLLSQWQTQNSDHQH